MKLIALLIKVILWLPIMLVALIILMFAFLSTKVLFVVNDLLRFTLEMFIKDIKKSSKGTIVEDILNNIKFD